MEAVREIHKVINGHISVDLPRSFEDEEVEVIVLPIKVKDISVKVKSNNGDRLFGSLHQYSNSNLITLEKEAWGRAIEAREDNEKSS